MKTALVTGATRGAGHAIAAALASSGWRVYALGRDRLVLEEMQADHGIEPLAIDLTDRGDLRALTSDLPIDALIHAALRWPDAQPFLELDEADIDMAFEVNQAAALHLTQSVLRGMWLARRSGHVFFLTPSGETGERVLERAVVGALRAFTEALGAELADRNIRLECVAVGAAPYDRLVAELLDRCGHGSGPISGNRPLGLESHT